MTPSWPTRIACPIVGVQLMLLSKIVDGRILFGCHYPTTNEWQTRRFSMSSVPQFTARGASHQNFPQAGQTHTAPNGLQLNFPSTERHLPYRGCVIKTLSARFTSIWNIITRLLPHFQHVSRLGQYKKCCLLSEKVKRKLTILVVIGTIIYKYITPNA